MKSKTVIKIITDVVMIIMLFLLMAFMITGQQIHEWFGIGMTVVFVLHNVLNFHWYRTLFKGRYTPVRIFSTIINIMMIVSIIALIYSGIVMSRHILIQIGGNMVIARKIHLMSSYWAFALMSIHIGMHCNMIFGILKKIIGIKNVPTVLHIFFMLTAFVISAIGAYSFAKNNIFSYMTLKNQFLFFDFQKSKISFFIEYFSIMILFASIAHYFSKLLKSVSGQKPK